MPNRDMRDVNTSADEGYDRREFLGQLVGAGAAISVPAGAATERVLAGSTDATQSVVSPNGDAQVTFKLVDGTPYYNISYKGTQPLNDSTLGFEFANQENLDDGFEVTGTTTDSADTTWQPVWGEQSSVRDNYEELTVGLRHAATGRNLNLTFRAYDDGVAFRYTIPENSGVGDFAVTQENTGFDFAGDYTSWWIANNWNNYEYLYNEDPLSQISGEGDGNGNHDRKSTVDGVNTPFTMRVASDCYMSIHEANLTDWAGMTVTRWNGRATRFESDLVPLPDGTRVKGSAPHASPWRVFMLGETPGDLLESDIVLNLNDPCAYSDTSWIEPQKYCGVWWELHIGKSTWAPGPDVGANTENVKDYIDFASEHGIPNVMAEGWNTGWGDGDNAPADEDGPFNWEDMNFTETHSQFDWQEVTDYATNNGVHFMAHNETGSNVKDHDQYSYEGQLHDAFSMYQSAGVEAIKSGYVNENGVLMDASETRYNHHCQAMVNHYQKVVETAAEYGIMVNAHEPIKPTGKRRTYPNFMSREGVSGMEYQNFRGQGNPPEHTPELAFTRMLAGPTDYNTGLFDLTYRAYKDTRVHNTRARELAQLVVFHSGVQMVTDRPVNYDYDLEAFQFVKDVPVDWDETKVLAGDIGQHVSIARRDGDDWWVGSAVADPDRLRLPLDFLDSGTYDAHVYQDGYKARTYGYESAVEVRHFEIEDTDSLVADLPEGGGQAVHLTPATGNEDPVPGHYETYSSASYGEPGHDATEFNIVSTGQDVWTGADDYTAVYEADAVGTDGRVRVEVPYQEDTDGWAKSGIVVRNDVTAAGSSTGYVGLFVTPNNGVQLAWDSDDDGYLDTGTQASGVSAGVRLRLDRSGSDFTGYYSTDGGSTWTQVGTCTVGSAASAQDAAMVHCSHSDARGVATFADFRVDDRIPMTRPVPSQYETFATNAAEFGLDQNGTDLHVNAAGEDMWTGADAYGALVDRDAVGTDDWVEVQLKGQEDTDGWAKSGIMIRNDATDPGSATGYVALHATPQNGVQFAWDADGDGHLDTDARASNTYQPVWLAIEKSGTTFTAYYTKDKSDGDWTQIGSVDLGSAASTQDAAMFTCSHASGEGIAEFANFGVY
ncbi:glycoside hydrolase family 97 catalytic domain-containing protein [Halorussus caseinilyticus]|uniref:Glycoside hydrolase family 97 catalytic domain-containing protein n=1 Tax=Halorussus caseinilyticus TaxID=3034025 RepID=A0ABD5WL26_9EURY|nr:glycoside hydrolase family 97 catalytic domain-containing protein [Halorussus sp. DT72]